MILNRLTSTPIFQQYVAFKITGLKNLYFLTGIYVISKAKFFDLTNVQNFDNLKLAFIKITKFIDEEKSKFVVVTKSEFLDVKLS